LDFIREKDSNIKIILEGVTISLMPEDFFISSADALFWDGQRSALGNCILREEEE